MKLPIGATIAGSALVGVVGTAAVLHFWPTVRAPVPAASGVTATAPSLPETQPPQTTLPPDVPREPTHVGPHWEMVLPSMAASNLDAAVDAYMAAGGYTPETARQEATLTALQSKKGFREILAGKTKTEVLALLGPPRSTNDGGSSGTEAYDYSTMLGYHGPKISDDDTGMTLRFITITFNIQGIVVDMHMDS